LVCAAVDQHTNHSQQNVRLSQRKRFLFTSTAGCSSIDGIYNRNDHYDRHAGRRHGCSHAFFAVHVGINADSATVLLAFSEPISSLFKRSYRHRIRGRSHRHHHCFDCCTIHISLLEDPAIYSSAQVRAGPTMEGLHTSHPEHRANYTPRVEDGEYIFRGNTESVDSGLHVESAAK
jgi:hypothetical protein